MAKPPLILPVPRKSERRRHSCGRRSIVQFPGRFVIKYLKAKFDFEVHFSIAA
jgi:hypothetical protein